MDRRTFLRMVGLGSLAAPAIAQAKTPEPSLPEPELPEPMVLVGFKGGVEADAGYYQVRPVTGYERLIFGFGPAAIALDKAANLRADEMLFFTILCREWKKPETKYTIPLRALSYASVVFSDKSGFIKNRFGPDFELVFSDHHAAGEVAIATRFKETWPSHWRFQVPRSVNSFTEMGDAIGTVLEASRYSWSPSGRAIEVT